MKLTMIAMSMTTLLAGVGLVATAPYVPSRLNPLERVGGLVLCAGLMIIGAGLVQLGH